MGDDIFGLLCEAREYVQECADIGYDRGNVERLLARMDAAGVPVPPPWVPPPEKPRPPPAPTTPAPAGVSADLDDLLLLWGA